jgi:methionyl-tRNA formyltransferase
MKIVFMGTPLFALPFLKALDNCHEVVGVVTQPDRPRGRGQKPSPSPVKIEALRRGLSVITPQELDDDFEVWLDEGEPEAIVVAAYGRILPAWLLDYPPLGCLNVHPSLLPKYRGAAPIRRALMDGEKVTGVSIIYLSEELDAGDILAQREVVIEDKDCHTSLEEKLSKIGTRLLLEVLAKLEKGELKPKPQDDQQATTAPKIEKEEMEIDWSKSSLEVRNLVRSLALYPGAFTFVQGKRLKVLEVEEVNLDVKGRPGEVVLAHPKEGFVVACGQGSLKLVTVKPEGGKSMQGKDFLLGHAVKEGERLG